MTFALGRWAFGERLIQGDFGVALYFFLSEDATSILVLTFAWLNFLILVPCVWRVFRADALARETGSNVLPEEGCALTLLLGPLVTTTFFGMLGVSYNETFHWILGIVLVVPVQFFTLVGVLSIFRKQGFQLTKKSLGMDETYGSSAIPDPPD